MLSATKEIITKYKQDKTRLMDILIDVQKTNGYISDKVAEVIAKELGLSQVDVEQTVSFYHFFSQKPTGDYAIYLNDSVVSCMMGRDKVAEAFEAAAGIKFGQTTEDGKIGLHDTACIGMNDQEPAAIINDVVFTKLDTEKANKIVAGIKDGKTVQEIAKEICSCDSMVKSNIRKEGPVLAKDIEMGQALRKVVEMSADEVINEVKESNLRGRGGAGFPTGMKWDFCRKNEADIRYVFCNADEGEPGTFKDRVLLTEIPAHLFEGMAIAGYAIGSTTGILYLRHEYKYLKDHLETVLADMRQKNLLGENICGKQGFNFDIRIQFGAGAYVCGEESALIESAEGKRGEPRDRPPFPVEKGYLQKPTVVNNVETLCAATKIMIKGGKWFKDLGTEQSAGTKILSISGDCENPGIYEVTWGMSIKEMLEMVGAKDVQAVQVAGPSGQCLNPEGFDRKICFNDLATGGSMIVIGKGRNIIKDVVLNFTKFFMEESCGSCVPCRAISVALKDKVEKILRGNGVKKDIEELVKWGNVMKSSRCGLGQTACNPVLTTIENFRGLYDELINADKEYISEFDLASAVKESCATAGRTPNLGGH